MLWAMLRFQAFGSGRESDIVILIQNAGQAFRYLSNPVPFPACSELACVYDRLDPCFQRAVPEHAPEVGCPTSGAVHAVFLWASSSTRRRKASIQVDIDSRPWRPSAINNQNVGILNLTCLEVLCGKAKRASSRQSNFYSVARVGISRLCASTNKFPTNETSTVAY